MKEQEKEERDVLSKAWDYIFEPHRRKREPEKTKPKKTKQIKEDQKQEKPKKEEAKQDDKPQSKPASEEREQYRVTERTYYTNEPPAKRAEQPLKPDEPTPDDPSPTPAREGRGNDTPEVDEVTSARDGAKPESDGSDGV